MVREISAGLNRVGIETDIMTFNMTERWKPRWSGAVESIDQSTIYKIPGLNWHPMTDSMRITMGVNVIPGRCTQIMKKYDIIHYHELELSFPLFTYQVKKPKILHLHGFDPNFLNRHLLSKMIFERTVDYYVAISRKARSDLSSLGISSSRILYLPNGVDTNVFQPSGEKEENLLLFVGRLTTQKGLPVLLRALRYVDTPVRLVVIGPPSSSAYYDFIRELARKEVSRGRHKIEILGDVNGSIVPWYQKASIFVLPSLWEGLPVVAIEALACGTPVVATSVDGTPEVVTDNENGFLVPANDPRRLAEKIQYLLENPSLRVKMGKEGRNRMIEDFSMDVLLKRLRRFYEEILSGGRDRISDIA